MLVRMKSLKRVSAHEYRVALDVIDPDQPTWGYGDCVVQLDLHDGIANHFSNPRGILKLAFDTHGLSPNEPPATSEARALWDLGAAVHHYVDKLFPSGVLCPFRETTKDDAEERSE